MARKSYYEIDALFPLVEKIVERLDAKTPEDLSLSKFDKARIELGYEDAPEGRVIARRLKLSWSEFAKVATDPRVNFRRSVQQRLGEPERKLRDNEVIYALWLVARRLGQETVAEDQYRRERKKLVAASDRYASELGVRLPNHDQIRTYVGDWKQALKLAGMEEPSRGEGVRGEDVVIEAFLHFGTRLSRNDYRTFCKANDISAEPAKQHPAFVCKAEERLREQGQELPGKVPWRTDKPDYTTPVENFLHLKDPPRRRSEQPTYADQELWDAFAQYYLAKDPNDLASWPDYDDYAREHGLPARVTLARNRTLAEYVEHAEDRLAEERRSRRSGSAASAVRSNGRARQPLRR